MKTKNHYELNEFPCKRCAECCNIGVCSLSIIFLDNDRVPCPALVEKQNGTFDCLILKNLDEYIENMSTTQFNRLKEYQNSTDLGYKFGDNIKAYILWNIGLNMGCREIGYDHYTPEEFMAIMNG